MRTIIALSLLMASTACAETDLTETEADDVALAIGSSTATSVELGAMTDAVQLARGRAPREMTFDGAWHRDTTGLAFAYGVTCRDDEDAAMPVCGAATHAAAVTVRASGSLDLPAVKSATTRGATWTLTALDGADDEIQLTGDSTLDYTTSDAFAGGAPTQTHLTYEASYREVALALTGGTARPVGGTIDYAVASDRTRGDEARSFTTSARVTFGPDGGAAIEVAGRHYHVDATTGLVARQ